MSYHTASYVHGCYELSCNILLHFINCLAIQGACSYCINTIKEHIKVSRNITISIASYSYLVMSILDIYIYHTFMKMNLVKVSIIAGVLVTISTAITEIFYILPDNSPNTNCPSHQCATFSQYFLENDTLPVKSNVEYHLLTGEHYVISTEMILLDHLQNFSLIGLYSAKLQLSSTILASRTSIVIANSYNVTVTNIIFNCKLFSDDINHINVQLVVCIYCPTLVTY